MRRTIHEAQAELILLEKRLCADLDVALIYAVPTLKIPGVSAMWLCPGINDGYCGLKTQQSGLDVAVYHRIINPAFVAVLSSGVVLIRCADSTTRPTTGDRFMVFFDGDEDCAVESMKPFYDLTKLELGAHGIVIPVGGTRVLPAISHSADQTYRRDVMRFYEKCPRELLMTINIRLSFLARDLKSEHDCSSQHKTVADVLYNNYVEDSTPLMYKPVVTTVWEDDVEATERSYALVE
jgi:hypothetical protein